VILLAGASDCWDDAARRELVIALQVCPAAHFQEKEVSVQDSWQTKFFTERKLEAMGSVNKLACLFLALIVSFVGVSYARVISHQEKQTPSKSKAADKTAQQSKKTEAEAANDDQEEPITEDLAPAAVQLDVSSASPLIQTLYQATRETKEQEILSRLAQVKKILDDGADLKATDSYGRTALHWTVMGSSYNIKPKVLVAYEEIADELIQKGVEINKEDIFQDTALDYLLYSPTFEIQTLLIENGATSGFLAGFEIPVAEGEPTAAPPPVNPQRGIALVPGLTMSIRLDGPVYSDRSRTGDPISGTVTYPLCKTGENIECKRGELLVSPGTKVNGTILFAAKAPNKYSRPRLVLDFSNIVYKNGKKSPLYARVIDVDNARETIRNNEILGIIQPHASTKATIAFAALSASNPFAGYAIKGVQTAYGLSIRREINFPSGTDLQIQIVRQSRLKEKPTWDGWKQLPVDASLQKVATSAPLRTATPKNIPSDPTNLMFLGSRNQLLAAFGEANWFEADDVNVKSALKVAQATIRQSGYGNAPMSTLLLEGRPPDIVFQKSLNTFAKRHHLRIWKLPNAYNGQEVWIAAATHDIATSSSRAATKWSHRIDSHVDREREWVGTDLLFVGTGVAYAAVDRPHAPKKLSNATGDDIVTDGKLWVIQFGPAREPTQVTKAQ
jgi:LssY C-terminus